MITEIVSFKIKPGMSRDDVLTDCRRTYEGWQANPDLIRKVYVMADTQTAMGIYLWTNIDAAKAGHDEAWLAKAEAYWGNRPQIQYLDTLAILDNSLGKIDEFPREN